MNINVEELGMCQVQLTVEPDAAQVEQAKKEVAKKYRKQVKIRGFRAGKAPLHMVIRSLGQQQLLDEVAQLIIQDVFTHALDQANLDIYNYDELHTEITNHEPLTYGFTFPRMPIIKLGELKWIKVTSKEVSFSDDQLHRTLEDIRLRFATVEPITGPAQYGDQAIYDLRIDTSDGSTVVDEKNKMEHLTATPNNVEENESEPINLSSYLLGLSVNQPHEFELMYPASWGDGQFSGQTMTYHIHITELKRMVLPDLNDEFAQTMAQMPSMDAWMERLSVDLLAQARRNEINRINTEILNGLVDESEIEYPQGMLKRQMSEHVANLEQQWKSRGTTLSEMLAKEGKTLDELEDDMRDDVERDLQRSLVLNQYIIANEISVTDEELEQEFEDVLRPYGPESGVNVEQLKNDHNFLLRLTNEIASRKGLTALYTTIIGETPPALYDEVIIDNALEMNPSEAEESATAGADEAGEVEAGEAEAGEAEAGEVEASEVEASNDAVDNSTEETTKEQSDSSVE